MNLDPTLLAILACPVCKGLLDLLTEAGQEIGLCCPNCKVVYPIREAIPIMLQEESIKLTDWEAGRRG